MKKRIRPPNNWQDFERLCKKLFGEIWKCGDSIKMHGRLGQAQSGVDVYARLKSESAYRGIQCKGKDANFGGQLTIAEIDEEIEKALSFKPPLSEFIFATTASKDTKIEEHIRLKDIESHENGKFSISLYCWEDLEDLIEENKDTFNWYVNESQFHGLFDVEVSLYSDDIQILRPIYERTTIEYRHKSERHPLLNNELMGVIESFANLPQIGAFGSNQIDYSWCKVEIAIINTGNSVIEDWKLVMNLDGDIVDIDNNHGANFLVKNSHLYMTTFAYPDELRIQYKPLNNAPLTQKDSRVITFLCKPGHECRALSIKWQLLARDFNREGELSLSVIPEIKESHKTKFVEEESMVRTETSIDGYKRQKDQTG